MDVPNKFWTEEDASELSRAKTFEVMAVVALRVIARMPQPVGQACGPITTGGTSSLEKNLEIFRRIIIALSVSGTSIFDQLPFEPSIRRVRNWEYSAGGLRLLEGFYLPIFKSGLIQRLYFIHGWESSLGARWEHERALELGISVEYLPVGFGGAA